MIELSADETHILIDSYVKSYGQRGAARALTKNGFRSPEGKEIQHGTVTRVLNGSQTRLLAPEVKDPMPGPEQALSPGELPPEIAPEALLSVVKTSEQAIAIPMPEDEIAKEAKIQAQHFVNRKILQEQLQEEIAAQKLREEELPGLVPGPDDHGGAGHPHLQELARVHAVFSPRANIELEEDSSFFMIPRLKRKPVEVRTRPHEVTHFGCNSLSTRDLSIQQKERS